MENVLSLDSKTLAGKVGVFMFTTPHEKRIWLGTSTKPDSRVLLIQRTLLNGRLPLDVVPRELSRTLNEEDVLLVNFVEAVHGDVTALYDDLKAGLVKMGRFAKRIKGVKQNTHFYFKVTHPDYPKLIYYGSYSESIGFKRAVLSFKQRTYNYSNSVLVCPPNTLAGFLRGKSKSFCNRLKIEPIPDLSSLNLKATKSVIKMLCKKATESGLVVLNVYI